MNGILNRPVTILMFHLMLAAFAVFAFMRLPIELTPEVDFPRLSVVTQWGQSSSEMIVRNITLPIEEAASTITRVKNVSSTSSEGRSVVNVELDKDADLNFARLELLEKLSAIRKDLPKDASFPVIQKYVPEDFSSLQGFLSYNLSGQLNLAEVQKYAEDNIKPALLGIKGVGSVRILGGAERRIYFLLERGKMQSLDITFNNVIDAIKNNTNEETVGNINYKNQKYFILSGKKIYTINELNNILITGTSSNALSVKLGSIAQIIDSLSNPISYVRINGRPSVSIEIDREPGTNMLSVASAVDKKIFQISNSLPSSLFISKIFDKSKDMKSEISELSNKAIISIIVIFIVVLLFFRNIFLSFVIVFSVAFSLAGGIIFLALSGIGLNVLTLAALALSLGIVIDNNVVVVENIHRVLEEESTGDSIKISLVKIISKSLSQIKLPLIAATFTTIGALVPVFFLPADLKPYFIQFAETATIVIGFSLLVALAFIPVSMLILLNYHIYDVRQKTNDFSHWLKGIYIKTINWIVLHKKTALVLAVWLFGFPVWLLPSSIDSSSNFVRSSVVIKKFADFYNSTVGSDLYINIKPYVDYALGGASQLFFNHVYKGEIWNFGNETYLMMNIYASQGTPVTQINRFTKQIENNLMPYKKEIQLITTRVSSDYGSVKVDFTDSVSNTPIPFIIKDRLTNIAAQTGGFNVSVAGFGPGYYSGGEATPNYQVEILGYSYGKVKEIAEQLSEKLRHNIRVDNIKIDRLPWENESFQVLAIINRTGLNQLGSNVSEFIQSFSYDVSSNLSNIPIEINNDPVNSIVKFQGYQNASTEDLSQKEILLNKKFVSLGGLITIKTEPVMPVIERDNQQYSRYITFDYKGPYKYGDEYTDAIINSFNLPPGYEIKRPQSFFIFGKQESRPLTLLGFLSVLIVFMVSASLYESFKKPLIIILSVPMSLIGLFSIFYLTDTNFGRGGYASILFLIGLAVNHGILLVDRIANFDFTFNYKDKISRAKMIAEASSQRLRPILITTVVTVAGFLPFVMSANIYSFWYSFSLGIIGGVTVSTLLILLFLPALYELISGQKQINFN